MGSRALDIHHARVKIHAAVRSTRPESRRSVTAMYAWRAPEGLMRVAVKRLNFDRHPEPLTRRQTGEVLAKIDIPVTCANVNDHHFGSVYPQPSLGGSGRILQTRRSGPPGSVVLSHGRNFPSRIETPLNVILPVQPCDGRTAGTFRVGLKQGNLTGWRGEQRCRRAGTFRVGLKQTDQFATCCIVRVSHGRNFPSRIETRSSPVKLRLKSVAGQELSESD